MSDPVRWRDAVNDTDSEVRELFASGSPTRSMSGLDQARSAARVAKIASAASLASSSMRLWIKTMLWSVGIGVVGAVLVAVAVGRGHRSIAPAARAQHASTVEHVIRLPQLSPTREVPAIAPNVILPVPTPVVPVVNNHVNAHAAHVLAVAETSHEDGSTAGISAIVEDPLVAEQRVLSEAHRLLDHDPAAALAQLNAHAREFPNGQLQAERELLRVMVLVRLGRHDEARAVGNALIARSPDSLYVRRVEGILNRDQ